ncbi:MAG: hypothetical protein DYG98_01660 [Haliscomenobacteraceae bacterium CHB4]|nr:hypothetical protein [Haliscomenobacteraceae bacterium CHB4]
MRVSPTKVQNFIKQHPCQKGCPTDFRPFVLEKISTGKVCKKLILSDKKAHSQKKLLLRKKNL